MERLLKTAEVALRLSISTHAVLKLAREKKLPHFRYGPRTLRFKPDEVAKYQANAKNQLPTEGV
jgi:excisionase family DNA binding protein